MVSKWEELKRYREFIIINKIKLIHTKLINSDIEIKSSWFEVSKQNIKETNIKI